MSALDDLLDYIFDDPTTTLCAEFEAWVRGSRRYKEFATEYRSKIRAKLRNVSDDDGLLDVRAELETAAILLRQKRFTLEYEHYAASKQRGPDFTLTFKTHTLFNVEVRRIRSLESDDVDSDIRVGKMMTVLCDKVGQMPPSIINLLWLAGSYTDFESDLTQAVTTLRQLAEQKDEDFFTRRGFESAREFIKQFRRLSGIILHQSGGNELWLNPIAQHKIPSKLVTALQRLGTN